jgi:rare lipoprotein A
VAFCKANSGDSLTHCGICWAIYRLAVCGLGATLFLAPRTILAHSAPLRSVTAQSAQELLKKGSANGPQARAQKEPEKEKAEAERGYAAFYSQSLEGHKTACGGTYSPTQLTAAHRTLPCGTKVRVTNLRNGKTVRVTVNDHGPASGNRVIDLSYAAAKALDFIKQGTTLVKVEVIR